MCVQTYHWVLFQNNNNILHVLGVMLGSDCTISTVRAESKSHVTAHSFILWRVSRWQPRLYCIGHLVTFWPKRTPTEFFSHRPQWEQCTFCYGGTSMGWSTVRPPGFTVILGFCKCKIASIVHTLFIIIMVGRDGRLVEDKSVSRLVTVQIHLFSSLQLPMTKHILQSNPIIASLTLGVIEIWSESVGTVQSEQTVLYLNIPTTFWKKVCWAQQIPPL